MQTTRTRHSADFKAKIALAALAETKSLAELASEYKVHPTQVIRWKQELVKRASDVFGKSLKKEASHEGQVAPLRQRQPVIS